MLAINHLIKSLQKQAKEARQERPLYQPTASFRQEACGYSDAYDKYTLTDRIETFIFGDLTYGNHR